MDHVAEVTTDVIIIPEERYFPEGFIIVSEGTFFVEVPLD
jgi:hypothetical protein